MKRQKLASFIKENHEFRSISKACELMGIIYLSVQTQISKYREKGIDFNDLLYEMLDDRNKYLLLFVDNKVYERALEGHVNASNLFYQRANAIDSGSSGDRNVIINQINIPIATNTKPPIDLIQKWEHERQDKD